MPIEVARSIDSNRRQELQTQLEGFLHGAPTGLTLEIGCGHGHFLAAYAQAHPNEHCLGVDIIQERLIRAEKKIRRAELTNAGFMRADARMLLETLPAALRLHRVFILFPDPWPKRRHHKNRLIQPAFLDLLAERATPETRIYFRTDHESYFTAAESTFRNHPKWELVEESWPFEFETVFQERAETHQSCILRFR